VATLLGIHLTVSDLACVPSLILELHRSCYYRPATLCALLAMRVSCVDEHFREKREIAPGEKILSARLSILHYYYIHLYEL